MVTRQTIAGGLADLGLPRDAVVLVHSSLSSLGYVDGGAEAVVDGFRDHLGSAGTLVVPTLPFRGYQHDYLRADPLFDPLTTPSLMGRITEAMRLRPGALRSWHPSHSVSAIGPAAALLTAPQSCDPWLTFGPQSPFGRLADIDGWICLLGSLESWREATCFTEAERAALALAEAVTRLSDRVDPVPDELWDEVTRNYDERARAALILSIATTNVYNRLNVTTGQVAGTWG